MVVTGRGGGPPLNWKGHFFSVPIFVRKRIHAGFFFRQCIIYIYIYTYIYFVLLMPGRVAMTTVSPAKMRGKNLRFLPTSFPFPHLSLNLSLSHSVASSTTAVATSCVSPPTPPPPPTRAPVYIMEL